jgi:Tfp pilus assembly protein PilN
MTRSLMLDFHPASARRARWGEWALLASALACAMFLTGTLVRERAAIEAQEARRDLLAARLQPVHARTESVGPELARHIVAANQLVDELAVPWDALFNAIESADARGLGVMSLAPNARQRAMRLTGEARSVPELLAYVDRLGALKVLDQVHLEGYETVQRDGVDVVSFTVAATWRLR